MCLLGGEAELINWTLIQLIEIVEVVLRYTTLASCLLFSELSLSTLLYFVCFFVTEVQQVAAGDGNGTAVVVVQDEGRLVIIKPRLDLMNLRLISSSIHSWTTRQPTLLHRGRILLRWYLAQSSSTIKFKNWAILLHRIVFKRLINITHNHFQKRIAINAFLPDKLSLPLRRIILFTGSVVPHLTFLTGRIKIILRPRVVIVFLSKLRVLHQIGVSLLVFLHCKLHNRGILGGLRLGKVPNPMLLFIQTVPFLSC